MNTTLLIMAAGMGSRYKGGIKALEAIGPNKEIIMDYSVHDAIAAGFNRIIFVIRKEIEEDFKALIFNRLYELGKMLNIEMLYVLQDLHDIPGTVPEGRTKPWGTCHAVLAARELLDGPFCVLNADDFYGKTAFRKVHYFLEHSVSETEICLAGFKLINTLSEHGGVTRGLCALDYDGNLSNIRETRNIISTPYGPSADNLAIAPNTCASMNMWGLTRGMVSMFENGFKSFLENMEDPLTSEFLLPSYIGDLLRHGEVTVKVLPTSDKWFGVTYIEDHPHAVDQINQLIRAGIYSEHLYSDLF